MEYESSVLTPEQVNYISKHLSSVGITAEEATKNLSLWSKIVSEKSY